MNSKQTCRMLADFDACDKGRKWAEGKDLKTVWEKCPRGDWLLWLAGKLGVETKLLVLSACACARLSLRFVPEGEDRPRLAIEAAERFAHDPSAVNRQAADAAAQAADDAAEDAPEAARVAALAAAEAALAAAFALLAEEEALLAAVDAAEYAVDAVAGAVYAARRKARRQCADEVRKIIAFEVVSNLASGFANKVVVPSRRQDR